MYICARVEVKEFLPPNGELPKHHFQKLSPIFPTHPKATCNAPDISSAVNSKNSEAASLQTLHKKDHSQQKWKKKATLLCEAALEHTLLCIAHKLLIFLTATQETSAFTPKSRDKSFRRPFQYKNKTLHHITNEEHPVTLTKLAD